MQNLTEKEKLVSYIIPNDSKNYTFTNEIDYYEEYSKSWFAHTKKKAGWDCLRHYEIMMNGCVPIFEDLENCPINTMVNLPKKEIMKFSKSSVSNSEYNEFILNYTRTNLTTKKLIKNLL